MIRASVLRRQGKPAVTESHPAFIVFKLLNFGTTIFVSVKFAAIMMSDEVRQPVLNVSLLGPFRMQYCGAFQALSLTGNTRELLAYLLSKSGEVTRRDVLIDLLWPSSTNARGRSALTTALSRIKKLVGRFDGLCLESFDDLVSISADRAVRIDTIELRDAYELGNQQFKQDGQLGLGPYRCLSRILRQPHASFLDGHDAHWVMIERERMVALSISALKLLIRDAENRGEIDDAINWAHTILSYDPLLESVHHDIIALYAKAGERRRAILQYERLWEILRDELGLEPEAKTTALRDRILLQDPGPIPSDGPQTSARHSDRPVTQR